MPGPINEIQFCKQIWQRDNSSSSFYCNNAEALSTDCQYTLCSPVWMGQVHLHSTIFDVVSHYAVSLA